MADLDSILSGSSESAPGEQEQVTQVNEGESQQEQPEAEQHEEQQGQRMVPQQALHAEKQKLKRYTEQVSDFQRQLSETNAAWERRMAQLVEAVKPKQEAAPRPDFFENPEAATQHTVQQSVSPQFEQINQQLLAIARDNAETRFTPETVNEAEQAFISAMQSQKLDPADYQKVVSSPNRYAAAVQWFKREQAKAEIGDDVTAFRAKVEAEILAKHGITPGEQQPAQQQRAQVMPSNLAGARNVGARSGPAWSGPSSIDDIFNRQRSG
jgi:hypothetical protein